MGMPLERPRVHYPLTRTYSLVSLIGVLLVALSLALFYRINAVDSLQRLETDANVSLTQAFANSVWDRYGEFVARATTVPPARLASHPVQAALRTDVLQQMRGLRVVKVKIYDRDGLTVFSTEAPQIGERKGDNEGFQRARAGEAVSDIIHRNQFNAFDRVIEERDLLSSYIPVRYGPGEPVVAVFELYSDLTPLLTEIEHTEYTVLAVVAGLMMTLYLFLFFFVRRADTIILRHEEQEYELQQERIRYLAQYDQVTGLPNRVLLNTLLEHILRRSDPSRYPLAVLYLDLDRFKLVNDNLGHEAGNRILTEIAARIVRVSGERHILARIGGDEFVLVVADVQPSGLDLLAQALIKAISKPISIGDVDVTVTVSVGITLYSSDNHGAEHLLKDAEGAMRRAKELGRNRYAFFTEELTACAVERFELEHGLHRAVVNQEFELYYQPRVLAASGRIVGAEALLRWRRDDGGVILPGLFIPLLEDMGLIIPVGEWVLRTACRQSRVWHDAGHSGLRVSVNLSMRQFHSPSLVADIRSALLETGLDASFLELELTESLLADDPDRTSALLRELKAVGVRLSIDDFGTGYSSLSYLMHFPIDFLKIDRSFVRDATHNTAHGTLTRTIVAMARSLGLQIVAEGIETTAQRDFLTALACDELQGYLFGYPMPAGEFLELLRRQHLVAS